MRVVPLVAVALVLIGCSGDDEGGATAASVDDARTAPWSTAAQQVASATSTPPATTIASSSIPATTVGDAPATTAASSDQPLATVASDDSILVIVAERPDLTILADLIGSLGQDSVFTQARGVTLLAPNDDAMRSLGDDRLAELAADSNEFTLFLSEHFSVGVRPIAELTATGRFQNALAADLSVTSADGTILVGGAAVVEADIAAQNGVVHVLAGVVQPAVATNG